jgi:transposase
VTTVAARSTGPCRQRREERRVRRNGQPPRHPGGERRGRRRTTAAGPGLPRHPPTATAGWSPGLQAQPRGCPGWHRRRPRLCQRGKADPTDALAIARVTAREQDLPPVRGHNLAEDLRLLVDYREQLLGERTRIANRVNADLVALEPGFQHQLPRAAVPTSRRTGSTATGWPGRCVRAELVVAGWTGWIAWTPKSASSSDGSRVWSRPRALPWSRCTAWARWSPPGSLGRWVTCAASGTGTGSPRPTAWPRSRASSGRVQRHRLNHGGNRRLNRPWVPWPSPGA